MEQKFIKIWRRVAATKCEAADEENSQIIYFAFHGDFLEGSMS